MNENVLSSFSLIGRSTGFPSDRLNHLIVCGLPQQSAWGIGKHVAVTYTLFYKKISLFSLKSQTCFFIQALLFPGGSVYNTTNTFSNISKCKSVDGKSSVVCPFQRADGGARQQGNPR